jgi:hypothetical protein
MKLADFLNEFQIDKQEWDALQAQIPPERMTLPGAAGKWSVKDILAHVTWYEKEMVGLMQDRVLAGSPLWEKPLNERNALIDQQNRGRSLEDVLKESQQVHAEVWRLAQQLSVDDLNDPSHFKDMPAEDQPWQYIVSNTYEHYRDHLPDLRKMAGQ